MTVPSVNVTKLEGQLNITPGQGAKVYAITGPCSAGVYDTPRVITRTTDLVSSFGYGRAVQAAAYAIEHYGAVLFNRSHTTTAGTAGTVTHVGTGAAVVTVDSGTGNTPIDDAELVITIVAGGTIATGAVTGATCTVSFDNGRNTGPVIALNLALGKQTIKNPDGSTFLVLDYADGALVAGDIYSLTTVSPLVTSTDVAASITAMQNTQVDWEILLFASTVDPTIGALLDAMIVAGYARGHGRMWMSDAVLCTAAQSDSAYQTAIVPTFSAYSTTVGVICASPCLLVGSVPQQVCNSVRPAGFAVAPLIASLPIHKSPAQPIASNALPGVSLSDINGNPASRTHNEEINPGLDDARFLTLRTWGKDAGIYVNLPKIMCAAGSDFDRIPKLRVWNAFFELLWAFFKRRVQLEVPVNSKTGYILESAANEIEKKAIDAVKALLSAPSASAVDVTVSRTDNLLSTTTPTLTVTGTVVPLGYPDKIQLNLGFEVAIVKV